MSTRIRSTLLDAAVTVVLAVVTLVETFPADLALRYPSASFRIHDHFNDVAVIHWDLWWMREAVVGLGVNPFETPLLFYPEGVNLFLTPFVPLFGVAAIPLQAAVPGPSGVIWAANVLAVLTFFLCAFFMVRLLRELGVTRIPALLAALPFAFAPFRFMHFPRLHYLASFWLPLYALFLVRFLDRGGRRPLIGTALVGLAALLSDHHHLIFLVFIAAAWVIYRMIRPAVARRVLLRRSLGCAALQVVVLAPVLIGCAGGLGGDEPADLQWQLHFERSADARPTDRQLLLAPDLANLAYVLFPHVYAALEADRPATAPADLQGRAPGGPGTGLPYRQLREDVIVAGPVPWMWRLPPIGLSILLGLVFVIALVRVRRPGKWVWGALCLTALLAALGPTRLLFDTPVPMPFRAFAFLLPPLKASRYPAAFILLALFAAAPVLAFGLQALFNRGRVGRVAMVVTVVLFLLAGAAGIYRPLRFEPQPRIEAYLALRDDPAPGAVVELPLGNLFLWRTAMAGQIVHGRPMAEGGVTRAGTDARRFLTTDPFMRLLQPPHLIAETPPAEVARRNLEAFLAAGFRYVLVHRNRYDRPEVLSRVLSVIRTHRPASEQLFGAITVFVFESDGTEGQGGKGAK